MATFTEQEWHELFTSTKTTVSTVLDSDGVLKNTLHNLIETCDITNTTSGNWFHVRSTVVESGVGYLAKPRYAIAEDTSSNTHYVRNYISFTSGVYYAFSFDVKANGRSSANILLSSGAFGSAVEWNFDFPTATASVVTSGTKDAGFIAALGNDEYRITLYAQATATTSDYFDVLLHNGTSTSYTGDGSSGVYLSRPRVYRAAVHAPVERVTNGTFDTDISGWTDSSETGGSISWNASGYLDLNTGASNANEGWASQAVATVVGETYRVSVDKVSGSCVVQVGTTTKGAEIATSSDDAADYVKTFVATSTTTYVNIRNFSNLSAATSVDNVSVTKVITNGMQTDLSGSDYVETSGSAEFHAGLEYDGNGALRGLQAFEGRTNSLPYSNDFNNAAWNKSNVTIAQDTIGPDGDLSAWTVTDGSGATTGYLEDAVTVANDSAAHVSDAFIKKTTSDTHYACILLAFTGGTAVDRRVTINTNDGTVSGASSPAPDDYGVEDMGDYWRVWLSAANNSTGNVTKYTRVYPAINTTGTTTEVTTATGSKVVYAMNTCVGSSPSPYIPTNGSTVSRGADVTFKALSEFGFKQDQYTVIVEFESAGSDGADYPRVFQLDDGTSSNRAGVYYDRIAGSLVSVVRDGASGANTAYLDMGVGPTNTTVKVASGFLSTNTATSDDGDAVVSDTSVVMPPLTTLQVGMQSGGANHLNGYIKKMVIFPARLTDATLVAESA